MKNRAFAWPRVELGKHRLSAEAVRTLGAVALGIYPLRLHSVKWAGPGLSSDCGGYFRCLRDSSWIYIDSRLDTDAIEMTLLHELSHALHWAVVGRLSHDLGWGAASSIVYRLYEGSVMTVSARRGECYFVTRDGRFYSASPIREV